MERATLHATKRQELGTRASKRLRSDGRVPCVLYGHQRDPVHLSVDVKALAGDVPAVPCGLGLVLCPLQTDRGHLWPS